MQQTESQSQVNTWFRQTTHIGAPKQNKNNEQTLLNAIYHLVSAECGSSPEAVGVAGAVVVDDDDDDDGCSAMVVTVN